MKTTTVKERPILLSGKWIKTIMQGRKTQTRRPCFRDEAEYHCPWLVEGKYWQDGDEYLRCPFGKKGDRLWVRETWSLIKGYEDYDTHSVESFDEWNGPLPDHRPSGWSVVYHADWGDNYDHPNDRLFRWRPSIHMPRWASRITLEVVKVWVERVQDCSEADALAEGVQPGTIPAYDIYAKGWNQTYGMKLGQGWELNPWVWVIEFKHLKESI